LFSTSTEMVCRIKSFETENQLINAKEMGQFANELVQKGSFRVLSVSTCVLLH
jgi:hypothetical protein